MTATYTRDLSAQSLTELTFVSDPQLCLVGQVVAYVQTTIRAQGSQSGQPRYRSQIAIVDLGTGEQSLFATPCTAVSNPRLSSDGNRLAFLGQALVGKPRQLYVAGLDSRSPRQLTDLPEGVAEFAWHPDAQSIALIAADPSRRALPDVLRTVRRTRYKQDGIGFLADSAARLHRCVLGTGQTSVMTGTYLSLGELAFAPDGSMLYFAAADSREDDDRWVRNLWAASWPDGEVRPLLSAPMMLTAPAVSPDGGKLAFLAATDAENFANQDCLWTVDVAGGGPTLVTDEFNAAPSIRGDSRYGAYPNRPHWLDAMTVLVNRNCDGHSELCAISVDGRLNSDWQRCQSRVITSFHADGAVCVFTAESPDEPGELYLRSENGREKKLTALNAAFCSRYQLARPKGPVRVETIDGPLTYWLLRPHCQRADGAVVYEIHAGAQTTWGSGFVLEFQLLAARGFTVLYGNPADAGSPRNSLRHEPDRQAARRDRFTVRYPRQMLAILADAQLSLIDSAAPVHLTGGSSGGYMTNWLVSHTDAFSSAVTERSISNLVSYYGTSDIGYPYTDIEHGGNPWDDFGLLWEQSPLKYAANVRTPMRILHAEQDHRCPISQAEEWFVALKRIGHAPVELVRFPDEGHELSRSGRPDRRIARLELIVDWFERHGTVLGEPT